MTRREVVWNSSLTWWELAHRYLDDGYKWPLLCAANPDVCPVDVPEGTIISVPDAVTYGGI